MTLRMLILAGLSVIASLAATPARADWREASTDHFLIYANAPESWVRGFAERLEKFDSGMRYMRKMDSLPEAKSNRLTIYVVPGEEDVAKLCGKQCSNVAGFYIPRVGGSIAYTPRNDIGPEALAVDSDIILFHEYTHHFLLENYAAAYPRWFNEGFAEFNSTAKVDRDGSMGFGRAAQHRAYGLLQLSPLPIETILDPDPAKMGDKWDSFYGRAWLLTHMLTFDDKRAGQLSKYLRALNAGATTLDAARQVFGDLAQLQKDMNRYLNQSKIFYYRIPPEHLSVGTITLRTLSDGEAAMMSVRMRSDRGVDHEQALALVPEGRKRAAPFPNDAFVQGALAEVELDAGNLAESEAAANRALAADPKNRQALIYKGLVRIRRAEEAKSTDPAVWKEARSWFIKANREDPNAAEALFLFYLSFGQAHTPATKNAILGLERAFELSPQDDGLRMTLAHQLLADERVPEARTVLLPLAYDPHARGEDNLALRMLKLIDGGAKGQEVLTKTATSVEEAPAN